jgi:hypothetical protein
MGVMRPPINVFLSSTYRDKEWREVARETIDSLPGFSSLLVEESPAAMHGMAQMVLDKILKADVFVVIVATSYGSIVPQGEQSFSEFEYEMAAKAGIPVVALVRAGPSPKELPQKEVYLLERFKNRLKDDRLVAYFGSIQDLRERLSASLLKLKESHFSPDFNITFDPELTEQEVKTAFEALANYYRACGGVGLAVEFEHEEAEVREPIHV